MLKVTVGILPLALITIGAVLLLMGDPGGAHAVAIGSVLAVAGAVLFAWIALIEILR